MKITCHSCQSKYTIADEKVLGKVVKIRCKKCAATIVVNGADGDAAAMSLSPQSLAGALSGVDDSWTVSVTEADQRNMSEAEVVAAFRAGVIDAETFCWKDGMADWMPLKQIESLHEACARAPAPATPATKAAFAEAPAPAARVAGGRAPAADLFGGFARAGGEDDVMTSVPVKIPEARGAPAPSTSLTGARNENSVLFSLNALTGKSEPVPPTEASGLIDIRQLSASMATEDVKRSRVEDIMNLSGGGAFMPTLTAPVLTSPAVGDYSTDGVSNGVAAATPQRSAGPIGKAVGAGVAVIVAAIGVTFFLMKDHGSASSKDTAATSASASSDMAPVSAPSASANATVAAPAATAAPSAVPPVAAAETAAEDTSKTAQTTAPPSEEAKPAAKEAPAKESHAAAKAEAPPPAEAGPFNLSEARTRLTAAAGSSQGCKRAGGPTGTGHVVIVFAPSGGVQSASVTGSPYEGTPTGSCVAAHFRGVRVPAFSGSPFSVSKSFTIN